MKLRIIPYKMGSKSARVLAEKLSSMVGYKVYRGRFPKTNRMNINWGSRRRNPSVTWINDPKHSRVARNKIETFKVLDGVCPIPPYTTDKEVANGWVSDGKTVFARTATGQGGSGITICDSVSGLVDAPLYTLYIKKKKEFRVHVVNGQVLFVFQKRKKVGNQPDPMIRSHTRGWVFCKLNIEEPEDLREIAVKAVSALNLNFGAVDVIWNRKRNQCYVLEVNTAPGISPQTAEAYSTGIINS